MARALNKVQAGEQTGAYKWGNGTPAMKEAIYRRTFNSDFNLNFHVHKNYTCAKCDQHKILKGAPVVDENEKKKL
ncbi:hypothetical protein PR048_005183 [Dryococelus australis]|uniref:Uncharacterized protein n=1 Tax=Dryococelus australis TaxID=614101 RepID=A0ABQ9I7H4_9NEOP|nr:hypothetical protein PR048_005183 [Dryococelus australis]